jgi:hypothetical protein
MSCPSLFSPQCQTVPVQLYFFTQYQVLCVEHVPFVLNSNPLSSIFLFILPMYHPCRFACVFIFPTMHASERHLLCIRTARARATTYIIRARELHACRFACGRKRRPCIFACMLICTRVEWRGDSSQNATLLLLYSIDVSKSNNGPSCSV